MQDELIKKIQEILYAYADQVSKGYELWQQKRPKTVEELLVFLCELFRVEEKAIEEEHKKSFVTDDYENGVRSFAIQTVQALIPYHEELKNDSNYMGVIAQKHMAYAFYHLLNMGIIGSKPVLENLMYEQKLYLGLVAFYRDFYGRFHDNEEAIELLCKYYPSRDELQENYEQIADALQGHISNAGTPGDLGYAYNGIGLIQQYICNLPRELIEELLKQYRLYDIVNQKVYRHQIFAIIHGSRMTEDEKQILKFFYLDSLMMANLLNMEIFREMQQEGREVKAFYNSFDVSLKGKKIQVFEEPDAYWDNKNKKSRSFWRAGRQLFHIILQEDVIVVRVNGRETNEEIVPYDYEDWALEIYQTLEMQQKVRNCISSVTEWKIEYQQMFFSLLYLDDYRGIKTQTMDFDHRFTYDKENRHLTPNEGDEERILHFYGETVHSLSCIVGKNGTGKTSIVDFLRGVFFKLIKIIEDFNIYCEGGYVREEDYIEYGILERNVKFLVVFSLGETYYYLTNMKGIKASDASPFQRGIYQSANEFTKVAYFSQQIRGDQREFFSEGDREDVQAGGQEEEKAWVARTLQGFRQCDYSEVASFAKSQNAIAVSRVRENLHRRDKSEYEPIVNDELCYQFSLMRNIPTDELCGYLDIPTNREFEIYNLVSGQRFERFSIEDFRNNNLIAKEIEEKYIKKPEIRIGYFSSGQYAKFTFLAKLYWFLDGYQKDIEHYNELVGEQVFSRDDALQEEETALLFIDEGELYYHPEWQRRYLTTLLRMISKNETRSRVQIILTTNSPFIISDVLKDDVKYLADQERKFDDTLGQNIHKLLKNNFFMDYTIGEYSRKLIEKIIAWLSATEGKTGKRIRELYYYFGEVEDEYAAISKLIRQIGEPVYRNKLEKMLDEWQKRQPASKERRVRRLEGQKKRLEAEIERLKAEEES